MKYKVTLNDKVYEVEVEKGEAILVDEYERMAPVAPQTAPAKPQAPQTAPVAPQANVNASASAVKAPLPGVV